MDAIDAIRSTREALEAAEALGRTDIDVASLKKLLDILEAQAGSPAGKSNALAQVELEQFKAELALWVAKSSHVGEWDLEGFRQVLAIGQAALRSILLINGGAAVALLAFLGHLAATGSTGPVLLSFADSLQRFTAGVFLAALAVALTYMSQLSYGGEKKWHFRVGVAFHVATILAAVGSLATFIWGSALAYGGFVGMSLR